MRAQSATFGTSTFGNPQPEDSIESRREITHKTNEITAFAPLLTGLKLTGVLVSADALHTQRAHARFLIQDKNADYPLTVKENQPGLFAQFNALPWTEVPVTHVEYDHGHGRTKRRTIQVLPTPDTINLPHAAQAFLVERYIADLDDNHTPAVAVLGLTSCPAAHTDPEQITTAPREHWSIENGPHHVRDVTFTEDASRVPHRLRPADHGLTAQPHHRHPAPSRLHQHHRRPALGQLQLRSPAHPARHRMTLPSHDFAGALPK